jgi:hypothetical protein
MTYSVTRFGAYEYLKDQFRTMSEPFRPHPFTFMLDPTCEGLRELMERWCIIACVVLYGC